MSEQSKNPQKDNKLRPEYIDYEEPGPEFYREDIQVFPSPDPKEKRRIRCTAIEWGKKRMAILPSEIIGNLKEGKMVYFLDLGTGVWNIPQEVIKWQLQKNIPFWDNERWIVIDMSGPVPIDIGEATVGGPKNYLETGRKQLREELLKLNVPEIIINKIIDHIMPIQFIFGDPTQGSLPIKDNSVDVVFSSMSFHHLPDESKKRVLREIFNCLKGGGRFIFMDTFNTNTEGTMLTDKLGKKPPFHGKEWKIDVLTFLRMLDEVGFKLPRQAQFMLSNNIGYLTEVQFQEALQNPSEIIQVNPNIWTLQVEKP